MLGAYADVHEENTITDSMNLRTRPAICMGQIGNLQGLIKFMCVQTGEKNVRRSYTRLPMPDSVIKKVEKLADRDKAKNGVSFKHRKKEIFDWENEEYSGKQQENK